MAIGAGMHALAEPMHTYTFDDLLAVPDDDPRRYEIVDGALVVSPSPGMRHEALGSRLRRLLDAAGLPDHVTVGNVAVDLHPSYRIPDLIVVSSQVAATDVNPVPTRDVQLAVEIVSPGSTTTDRVTKPAQYAAYGIPAYWRVESRPEVTLTAYELAEGATAYTEVGTWRPGETARLTRPFPIEVPIDALAPGQAAG